MNKNIRQSKTTEKIIENINNAVESDSDALRRLIDSPLIKDRIKIVYKSLEKDETSDLSGAAAALSSLVRSLMEVIINSAQQNDNAEGHKQYPLRGTLLFYTDPTAPVGEDDWNAMQ